MGIFDFLNRNTTANNADKENSNEIDNQDNEAIIDRNLFLKSEDVTNPLDINSETSWQRIFNRIRKNYETEGYNDALSTADNKYRNDNLEILKLDLEADIQEAEINIKEYLKEVEFHINSRRKADLNDLVEELESKKEICLARLEKMKELRDEIKAEEGTPKRMMLAYKRGFNKGLAALTVANIINRNI
jgi:hypothetical protein